VVPNGQHRPLTDSDLQKKQQVKLAGKAAKQLINLEKILLEVTKKI
jgi:hypothetical protein